MRAAVNSEDGSGKTLHRPDCRLVVSQYSTLLRRDELKD